MNISTLKPMTKPVISATMLTGTSLIFFLLINPVNFVLSLVHEFILTPIMYNTIQLGKYLGIESAVAVRSMSVTSQFLYDLYCPVRDHTFWHLISFEITFAIQMVILYYLIKSFTCFHAKIAGTKSKNFKCLIGTCLTLYSFFWGYILFIKILNPDKNFLSWVFEFNSLNFLPLDSWGTELPLDLILMTIDYQFIAASLIALTIFLYKQKKA